MKMTNYRLQTQMEQIKPSSTDWYKSYIREILESDKPYHVKADYIGLSFQELQNKIDYLSDDIKELQLLKKTLSDAKTTALEATAEVLSEYGVDRIDGTAVSSITITPAKTKTKDKVTILNADALISLGYVNLSVDEKAVAEAMCTIQGMDEIDKFVEVSVTTEEVPARIKINAKRSSVNNQATELLKYTVEDAA